jgi:cyclopropane-fatty-acyl-phospholipid synthase
VTDIVQSFERIAQDLARTTPFAVRFPNGDPRSFGDGAPAFTLHFKNFHAIVDTVTKSSLGFGDAFVRGDIDVEGDLPALVRVGFEANRNALAGSVPETLKYMAGFLNRHNSKANSKTNIAAHYDLSNDFFRLWLDEEMQYTCAYFDDPADTLEVAQRRKMDRVCRKLALKPGETVVEAGGGWGGLALHMARHYGVTVKSFNISQRQLAFARERAAAAGIGSDRLEYIEDDYRNIRDHVDACDKFASICMLEHVGKENLHGFFDLVGTMLRPKGLAMIQFISRLKPSDAPNPWLEQRVFPGYYNPSLGEAVAALESKDAPLLVLDVENMRPHYTLTLLHWLQRLDANGERIAAEYGEEVLRTFRLYLAGGMADFDEGRGTQVYQLLLGRTADNGVPLHRARRLDETFGMAERMD